MISRKVLVVGAAGYFGRLLIDDLLRHSDCDVIGASRRHLRSSQFETIVADRLHSDPHGAGKSRGAAHGNRRVPHAFGWAPVHRLP
jgi:nucleoside-diphosphate-sugar epimerase